MSRDRVQDVLCSLLSDAIRGRPPRAIPALSRKDWSRLMELAQRHDILALLYPAVAGLPAGTVPADRLVPWRHLTLQTGMREARRFHEALDITHAFAGHALPCVAFKGVSLRSLYPQPDLRTMGDIDLLIRPENLTEAEALLREQGLRHLAVGVSVQNWTSGQGMPVELHTALFCPSPGTLDQAFFKGAIRRQAEDRSYFSPPPKEAAIYQVQHMAKHIRYLGFGLRELADFTLQIEQGLELPLLLERLDALGSGQFGRTVLLVARDLLGLELSNDTITAWNIPPKTVDHLAEAVLSAGTHGQDNPENALSLIVTKRMDSAPRARWRFLGWLAFPPAPDLDPRYAYAQTRRWLLPWAWIHRLVRTAVLAPAKAFVIVRFGARYLFTGNRHRRLLADLGLRQP
jgi:hypothetical protein